MKKANKVDYEFYVKRHQTCKFSRVFFGTEKKDMILFEGYDGPEIHIDIIDPETNIVVYSESFDETCGRYPSDKEVALFVHSYPYYKDIQTIIESMAVTE